jgi:hypothetical protein
MAKTNLTDTQKSIIKKLTDEFVQLNAVAPEPKGLIDVAGIMEQTRIEKQFYHECDMANKTFTKLKCDAMLKDMETIRGDLAKLNLGIKRSYEGAESLEIFPTHKPYEQIESYNRFRIDYQDSHHYERQLGSIKQRVQCRYCISFEKNSIFRISRETFKEFIQCNEFHEKLKWLYEATLK